MKKVSFKWMIALLAAVFTFVMFGSKTQSNASTAAIPVTTWAELKDAIEKADDNATITVILEDSEDLDSPGFEALPTDSYISIGYKKNVTIDFNGHVLDGRALKDVEKPKYYGAFYNLGTLKLKNGSIYGCYGISGAVYNSGDLTIESMTFQDNTAYITGGAICNLTDCTCRILSADFSDNTSFGDIMGAISNSGNLEIGDPNKPGMVYFGSNDYMFHATGAPAIKIVSPLSLRTEGGTYSSTINIRPGGAGVITSGYATYNTEDGKVKDPSKFFRIATKEAETDFSLGLDNNGEVKVIKDPTTTYKITFKSNNGKDQKVEKTLKFKNTSAQFLSLDIDEDFYVPEDSELAGWKLGDKVYEDEASIDLKKIYEDQILPTGDTTINVEILAQWRKLPKLTVKATSVDGSLGIEDYVVSVKTGTNVLEFLDDDEIFSGLFEKEGYQYSGILPKDISEYESRADVPSEDELEEMTVEGDTTVYALMGKEFSASGLNVMAPVCGQEIKLETLGDFKSQTNKPELTFAEDAVCSIDEESKYGCIWCAMSNIIWPYTGQINGDNSYIAYADLITDLGYVFDENDPVITGGQVVPDSVDLDDYHIRMGFKFTVSAVHEEGDTVNDNVVEPTCEEAGHHDEVVKCKACDYLFEDTRVSDIKDEALGHDWGEWIVVKDASETEDGLEVRTCKRDASHTDSQIIPKKGSTNPDDKQDGGKQDGGNQNDQTGVKVGDTVAVAGSNYKVLSGNTVAFVKAKNAKKVIVPAAVKIKDKKYNVTSIKPNAFKKSKATKVVIKTKNLKKATVKNSLKGSKVKKIQIKVGKKKVNKTYLKKYKKIFTKKNAGKKVTISL